MDYFTYGTVEFRSQDFVRNEEKYILFFWTGFWGSFFFAFSSRSALRYLYKNIITTRTRSDGFIPVIRVL